MRHPLRYADWSWREYAAAARCILSGRVKHGRHPDRLATRLAAMYAPSTVYPVNFGHTAIRIALDIFRSIEPARTEVVVPAYICPSVVETIAAAGLTAVPAAVGADLNMAPAALGAVLGPATLAVVAPHMFGCPARIAEIEAACRAAGVFLIDDAAQVVGERCDGRLLGTFGDVGIISFAQSKAVVTGVRGSGGVLLVNNRDLDAPVRAAWSKLGAPGGRLAGFAHFAWDYLWSRYTGDTGYYLQRLGEALGRKPQSAAGPARISNLDAAIALVQLQRLPRIRERKIAAGEAYRAALSRIAGVCIPQYAPGRYLSRIMVSLPPDTDLPALRAELKRRGVDTRLGYQAPVRAGQPDEPALARARRLLGLPFGGAMAPARIEEICGALRAALAAAQPHPLERKQNEPYQTAH
jgi:dTDP-4-amino-4,6-dideoxygalactose transaminase